MRNAQPFDDEFPIGGFLQRSREGVLIFFAAMALYLFSHVVLMCTGAARDFLSTTWSLVSMAVDIVSLAVSGHYLWSLRRRTAGVGCDDRTLYQRMVTLSYVILGTMLVHTWLLGSMNSMHFLNALLVFIMVAWILRFRDALIVFLVGNAVLAIIVAAEIGGIVPYAPVLLAGDSIRDVFLHPVTVLMVIGIYVAYALVSMYAVVRFQRVVRLNHDRFAAANAQLTREVEARTRAEAEKEIIIENLNAALADIKQLKGMLPICSSCKKVRDDDGYWLAIDLYLRDHADVELTHGICPECAASLYPDMAGDPNL